MTETHAKPFETMFTNADGWSDWIHPLPGYRMKCCDCGLVHEMQTAITPNGGETTIFSDGESEDGVITFRMKRKDDAEVVARVQAAVDYVDGYNKKWHVGHSCHLEITLRLSDVKAMLAALQP